jgi:hypothetical protein
MSNSNRYVPVTKEKFFAIIGPLNVHPRPEPYRSVWVHQETHAILGIATPGYLCRTPNGAYTASKTYSVLASMVPV